MDTTRWHAIRAVFEEALDYTSEHRPAFLDARCAGDDALRREVEQLLGFDAAAGPFLGHEADDDDAPLPDPDARRLGTLVGAYRLAEILGRGGMGVVYRAERADGLFAQVVAVKLVRHGFGAGVLAHRLRAEQQILARLRHPHIARLYDGGLTGDGLPFLVMEYVEGQSITDYCRRHHLPVDARLRLLLQVCDAVAYAHRNLVVHRDLKPSNILVAEEDGTPAAKLLDFGIARLLQAEDEVPASTQAGQRVMTPAYAAPEQVRGEPVTTATDVYALGVVLYELLAGSPPYRLDGLTPAQVERIVCETEPAPPSAAAQATPHRRLAGDLDVICLKALRKEPERRYASAEALAEDVRRHLGGWPVQARPTTFGYRAARFIRRHRAGVAGAALVALAVLGGAAATAWQARQARVEAEKARATLAFLQNTLYGAEPGTANPDATIREALDSAALHIERDLAGQPLVAASVHSTVGYSYFSLGLYDRAEHHQRQAAALYARGGRQHRLDYGVELQNLAVTLDNMGRTAEALPLFEQSVAIQRAEGSPYQHASALNAYATALDALGRAEEAEARYREAIAFWRRADAPQLPLALNNLAILYESTRRTREAVPLVEEAVRSLRAQGPPAAPELAQALATLGSLYDYTGRPAEGAAALDEALGLLRRYLGPEHPRTLLNTASRALIAARAGRPAEALPLARLAYDGTRRTLPADHPIHAHAETILGQTLCAMGADSARAGTRYARQALAMRRALYGPDHFLTATSESVLGACLASLGHRGEAEPLLVHAYETLRAARGDADARTADARQRLDAQRRAAPTSRAARGAPR